MDHTHDCEECYDACPECNPHSFRGHVVANSPLTGYRKPLLGGVLEHHSSRFETEKMAREWVDVIVDTNTKAGRPCSGYVTQTAQPPEILEKATNNQNNR